MLISEIISEADILVPNGVDQAQKLVWLNAINSDFFNVVKIPRTKFIPAVTNTDTYNIDNDVKDKNVFLVRWNAFFYSRLNYEQQNVNMSFFTVNDAAQTLTLSPAPFMTGPIMISYYLFGTTAYTSGNLNAVPDAPVEYHWTYVPALAAYLAKTEDDGVKAANFEAEYKSAWNVAAQNYQQVMPS